MSVTPGATENFDFGRVMSQIGGLIGRNFVPFFVLALLFSGIPTLLIYVIRPIFTPVGGSALAASYNPTAVLLIAALSILPAFVLQAALTRAAIDDLSGKPVLLSDALAVGLRFLFPLFGLAILEGLGVGLAFLVFIIPGIILAVCWIVSTPALVVEKMGIFQAMQRSMALTRNHRWALFGLLLLFAAVVWIISILLLLVTAGSLTGGLVALSQQQAGLGVTLVVAVIQSLEVLISTVGIAAIYFELRRIKEGVGVNDLAAVFD